MGHKWKRWYASPSAEPEIDLLSTAFGLPSRWDFERASETIGTKRPSRYDSDSDVTSDDAQIGQSDDGSGQSSIYRITRKSKDQRLDHLVTPIPKSISRKRQHAQSRSSSLKSQQSTLSKKIRGYSSKLKIKTDKCKRPFSMSTLRDEDRSSTSASPSTCLSTGNELQGSQKSPSPPGWINSNAQHSVSSKTSRPPLQYTPQVIPTFLPHYVPAYLFQPRENPQATQTPKGNQETSSYSLGSNFQELQRLQFKLDCLQQELLQEPADSQLHKDHRSTQSQLNNILDSIVARNSNVIKETSLGTAKTHADTMKFTEPMVDKENVAPAAVNDEVAVETRFPSVPQGDRDQALSTVHLREKSPSCTIRHHLCSGCGSVRSQQFHQKHPICTWHKPVLNFCSSCRTVTLKKGRMGKHHFCFGCGKVRSKAFQKKHKHKPGHPLLPNYCGSCTAEVRVYEGLNEISVLGLTTAQSTQPSERTCSIANTSSSSVADLFRHGLPSYCKSNSPTEKLNVKTSKPRNAAKLRLDHTSAAKTLSAPVSPAESSPFYPGRRLGSAQRRAQREPATHFNSEHQRKTRGSAVKGEYHAPYVEEAPASEHRMSRSNYSDVESLDKEDISDGHGKKKCQESRRKRHGTRDQKFVSSQSASVIYERTAALQSTNSSDDRTVRCSLDNHGQRAEKIRRGNPYHDPQDFSHQDFLCEPSRSSKGVFRKSNKNSDCGSGQATRRKSPLADIECSHYTTFTKKEDGKIEQLEPPPFRSSRGAFGPNYSPKQSHFSMHQYGQTSSSLPGVKRPAASKDRPTPNAEWEENNSHSGAGEYSQPGHRNATSPSLSGSNAGKPTNEFKFKSTYARSVFTDYSRSTDNPYYKPRSRPFHNATNSDFCSTWDWKSNMRPNAQNPRPCDGHFDDGVPEPIIEEPASPSSSPVQPTKLLEFHTTSDNSSCEPETDDDDCSVENIHLNYTMSFPGSR